MAGHLEQAALLGATLGMSDREMVSRQDGFSVKPGDPQLAWLPALLLPMRTTQWLSITRVLQTAYFLLALSPQSQRHYQ